VERNHGKHGKEARIDIVSANSASPRFKLFSLRFQSLKRRDAEFAGGFPSLLPWFLPAPLCALCASVVNPLR
jgi:hypothetical protein